MEFLIFLRENFGTAPVWKKEVAVLSQETLSSGSVMETVDALSAAGKVLCDLIEIKLNVILITCCVLVAPDLLSA